MRASLRGLILGLVVFFCIVCAGIIVDNCDVYEKKDFCDNCVKEITEVKWHG